MNLKKIRDKIRAKRCALPQEAILAGSLAIANILGQHPLFKKSKRIASFIAMDGEQDPDYVNLLAWQYHKRLFLPKLRSFNRRLWFVEYTNSSPMQLNKFSIPEPKILKLTPAWSLDLVLVPLVAFDRTGNRLGMGGGYYDISFESNPTHSKRSKMVGIAHSFQELASLKPNPWDIPLNAIVTEQELILC